MDPNASTQMPEGYQTKPLGATEDLSIKFYVFGTLALVIAAGIGYGMYVVLYRKTHQANKEVRYERQVSLLPRFSLAILDARLTTLSLRNTGPGYGEGDPSEIAALPYR
jgi:hypothetical protein